MTEWRDISSAPKDGTSVLLYSAGAYHGLPFPGQYHDSELRPGMPWVSLIGRKSRLYEHVPTHWQPLPQPPKDSQ